MRLEQLYANPALAAPDPRRLSQASCTLIKVQVAHLAGILHRKHVLWLADARKRFERQQALNRHSHLSRMAPDAYKPSVRNTLSEYFTNVPIAPHEENLDFEHEPLFNISDLKADSTGAVKPQSLKMAMKKFMDRSNETFMAEEKERWAKRQRGLLELNAAIREGHLDKIDDALKDDTVIEIE